MDNDPKEVFILVPQRELIALMQRHYDRAGAVSFLFSKTKGAERSIGNAYMRLLHDYGRDFIMQEDLDTLKKVKDNAKKAERKT